MKHVEKYYIQGFAMVVSPGRVANCDIFFRSMGHSPAISGVDLYTKEGVYLGFIYPQNLDIPVKRAILAYIKAHPRKWHRVYSGLDMQQK